MIDTKPLINIVDRICVQSMPFEIEVALRKTILDLCHEHDTQQKETEGLGAKNRALHSVIDDLKAKLKVAEDALGVYGNPLYWQECRDSDQSNLRVVWDGGLGDGFELAKVTLSKIRGEQ